jgi:hypothetical protein
LPYSFWVGIVLILIAGVMAGDCMLPLKFSQRWKWENTWLVFSLVSLVALPWALALIFVNHPFQTYSSLTASQFAVPILFGAGWGIAQVLFGVSIERLGLALAYAIVGYSHGDFVDGRVCALWYERSLSGPVRNLNRLGTVSNLHDHDRDPLGCIYRGVERCAAFPGLGHDLSRRRNSSFGGRESLSGMKLNAGNFNAEFFEGRNC